MSELKQAELQIGKAESKEAPNRFPNIITEALQCRRRASKQKRSRSRPDCGTSAFGTPLATCYARKPCTQEEMLAMKIGSMTGNTTGKDTNTH